MVRPSPSITRQSRTLGVCAEALQPPLSRALPPSEPFASPSAAATVASTSAISTVRRPSKSRLQRRLESSLKRDRIFFNLVRRKRTQRRNRPSWLSQQLSPQQSPQQRWRYGLLLAFLALGLGGATWTTLFVNEQVTLGGVPYRIVHKFWQDKAARDAYFAGDRQALHDELSTLGVEDDIKDFYRDRFDSEYKLDRYIHQLMFNQTGYVGEAYEVDNYGQLRSRSY